MTLDEIQDKVLTNEYDYTLHAEIERKADSLTFHQIEAAILEGEILEHYPDGGRGESCLFLGLAITSLYTLSVGGGERELCSLPFMYRSNQNLSIHGRGVIVMEDKKCNFCGSPEYGKRRTDYLYSYRGNYLLVPNTPVEVCLNCGMVYFDAKVLKEIEERFFAIQRKSEKPDGYVELPMVAYA